jgi:hypothetical protein
VDIVEVVIVIMEDIIMYKATEEVAMEEFRLEKTIILLEIKILFMVASMTLLEM